MLLTITTTARPATDLGFLLVKHPQRVQAFEQSFGTAHVFYPDADEERCTAALLLDVDPVKLAKTRRTPDVSLGQYVNDRPYAASSLLASAMANVFRSAMRGRSADRPELAATPMPLTITLPALPCLGGPEAAVRVFEPLGWKVDARPIPLDERFPEWGDSRYVTLRLDGELRLADALNQLYVLLPVLDSSKHYWVDMDEVDKLIRAGDGWLAAHPERSHITRRYLANRRGLVRTALARLADADDISEDTLEADPIDEETRSHVPLAERRIEAVLDALRAERVSSVIDLGCGSGKADDPAAEGRGLPLRRGHGRLGAGDHGGGAQAQAGPDAVRAAGPPDPVHLSADLHRPAIPRVRRRGAHGGHRAPRPATAARRRTRRVRRRRAARRDRHHTERRAQRALRGADRPPPPGPPLRVDPRGVPAWTEKVAGTYGYGVRRVPVGDDDPEVGPPTQMGVFTR